MIALARWVSPDVLRDLGLTLLHFLWQGAVLAALAAVGLGFWRRASARYAVGVVCLLAMAAAPLSTFVLLRNHAHSAQAIVAIFSQGLGTEGATVEMKAPPPESPVFPGGGSQAGYLWLVEIWMLGVLVFSLRTAGGVLLIERLRRRQIVPVQDDLMQLCRRMQVRLGLQRAVRFCESLRVDSPAVVGWIRPMILLPVSALTGLNEAQLEAVIAHELAHVRRYDAFVNLFQIAVEALLFYHPAVWWLNKRIREERENACDDLVVEICGSPLEYARALALLEGLRMTPAIALGANHGSLASRIRRILGMPTASSGLRSVGLSAGIAFLCVAAAAGHALLDVARPPQPAPPGQQVPPAPKPVPPGAFLIEAPALPAVAPAPASDSAPNPVAAPEPPEPPAPQDAPKAAEPDESYIDSLKAVGLENLSADELISLKTQGVTADYVRRLQAEGLKPNVDELIGMKVQGVTPEYVQQLRADGLKLDVDGIIGMKVQGITPDYIRQMKELGLATDTDSLIGMKVQGITPDYVHQMRDLGLKTDSDSLIGMKVQGITPDYVQQVRALGLKSDADNLIGMKVQGITPDYVKQMQGLGLHPDADGLIGMKVQGVTPDYVKALQAAGFKVDVDDCISAKIAGVTPEFIAQARSHGFKDLTLEQLVELKHAGVLEK